MGMVLACIDRQGRRGVAIKVLREPGRSEIQARFAEEARILSQIEHPNILRLFDHGAEGDLAYLVTELVSGRDLDRAGEIPLDYFWPLAEGLEFAHRQGILHRDIKPANLIFDGQRIVLIDFGLARLGEGVGLTKTGAVVGTLRYLAPEILFANRYGPESDWWAFGLSLYWATHQRHLFEDSEVHEFFASRAVPADLLSRLDPKSRADRVVAACLGLGDFSRARCLDDLRQAAEEEDVTQPYREAPKTPSPPGGTASAGSHSHLDLTPSSPSSSPSERQDPSSPRELGGGPKPGTPAESPRPFRMGRFLGYLGAILALFGGVFATLRGTDPKPPESPSSPSSSPRLEPIEVPVPTMARFEHAISEWQAKSGPRGISLGEKARALISNLDYLSILELRSDPGPRRFAPGSWDRLMGMEGRLREIGLPHALRPLLVDRDREKKLDPKWKRLWKLAGAGPLPEPGTWGFATLVRLSGIRELQESWIAGAKEFGEIGSSERLPRDIQYRLPKALLALTSYRALRDPALDRRQLLDWMSPVWLLASEALVAWSLANRAGEVPEVVFDTFLATWFLEIPMPVRSNWIWFRVWLERFHPQTLSHGFIGFPSTRNCKHLHQSWGIQRVDPWFIENFSNLDPELYPRAPESLELRKILWFGTQVVPPSHPEYPKYRTAEALEAWGKLEIQDPDLRRLRNILLYELSGLKSFSEETAEGLRQYFYQSRIQEPDLWKGSTWSEGPFRRWDSF